MKAIHRASLLSSLVMPLTGVQAHAQATNTGSAAPQTDGQDRPELIHIVDTHAPFGADGFRNGIECLKDEEVGGGIFIHGKNRFCQPIPWQQIARPDDKAGTAVWIRGMLPMGSSRRRLLNQAV